MSFLGGLDGRVHLQCRRPGFNLWVRKIPLKREWQPTPVVLPGEFCGQRNLTGYGPWRCKELDMTDQLTHTLTAIYRNAITLKSVLCVFFFFFTKCSFIQYLLVYSVFKLSEDQLVFFFVINTI